MIESFQKLEDVFARAGKLVVIAALVFSTGAYWAALQTIAWTTMLAANLSTSSIAEAVTKTFDGQHPCPLCKAIAAAKKSEKKSEVIVPLLKMEFPPVADKFILIVPNTFHVFWQVELFTDSTTFKPPVPPPRSFFA